MKKYFNRRSFYLVFLLLCSACSFAAKGNKVDSLIRELKKENNDTTKAKLYYKICKSFREVKPDSAIYFGDEGIAFINKVKPDSRSKEILTNVEADICTQLGICYNYKGDLKKSLNLHQKCFDISKKNNYKKGVASGLMYLASNNMSSGNYDQALKYAQEGLQTAKEINDKLLVSGIYNVIGLTYKQKGDYAKAIENYYSSLTIREELKDSAGILGGINNIGHIYLIKREFNKAIEYFNRALKICELTNGKRSMAVVLLNLGNTYNEMNDFEKSLDYHFKSLKLAEELNDPGAIRDCYGNIGNAYNLLKNYPKALDYHNRSFAITLQYQDTSSYAAGYNCLAADYMELKNYPKAIESHMKGLALGKKLGDAESIEYAYDGLIKCYTRSGDFKKALEYKTLFHKLRDSLLNSKNFEEMASLKAGYELEQKDRERALIMQAKEIEQKAALDKQKMISLFLLIGGSIVLILAAVAVRAYLNKKKANVTIAAQKKEVEIQKEIIEEKQKEIIDSINYAKRIQSALLAHKDFLNDHIANNFVLFKPKDIVSGDFYWAASHEGSFYLAVCDSTGHGVPGAFMSLLNIGFLSEAINEKNILEPHLVLNYVRERLIKGISKEGQRDGFDGILLRIDQATQKMTYAAANNAPIIIRNNDIIELPKDKMPVGKGERTESFQVHAIDMQKGDTLYLYTDGYADQFGGPKGKKFLYKRLNELLKTISLDDIHNHGDKLNSKFEEWRGALEQVDDVCVIGIKL